MKRLMIPAGALAIVFVFSGAVLSGVILAVGLLTASATRAEAASPDGLGRIAYVGQTCEKHPNPWIPSIKCSSDTYRVRTDGSGVTTQLTRNPLGQFGDIYPSFSPDGEKIAFVGSDEGYDPESGLWEMARNVFVMNANGTSRVNLTKDSLTSGHTPSYDSPSWFPSGNRIVFSKATRESGYYADLYTLNVSTGKVVQLTSGGTHEYAAAVSPDGERIAYMSTRDGDWEIYVMKATPEGPDNQPVQLTNNEPRVVLEGYPPVAIQDESPTWSADSTQIAFSSDRDGDSEIYRMKARPEGGRNRPIQLTNNETRDADPAWSPNGKRMAYSGAGDVWVMEASDGSTQVKLTTNQWADGSPSWRSTR